MEKENSLEEFLPGYLPKEVNMDGPSEWGAPSLEGQFSDETLWEQDGWSVKVYDLSKEGDVDEYQELLTSSAKKDPEVIIIDQEKNFCESSDNWKIFVTSVGIKYRNLKKNGKK